ncbi:MAG: rRNA maturation RNase YbeY [Spirochaetales bacterium]|uniref:rRNA maturation RNase YbeY n=1 Tax=Treponema berlinense TaxID=225004 RepID=UPI002355DB94|nr:rRNA maturation RNase YbeY [Treponema berlinense]MDD5835216.1 rRNA maturation RNase YbeY [Treponema berlinense]MDO5766467.1 rRNA maturation RNase YbeY [Spirochaetales bacterium]
MNRVLVSMQDGLSEPAWFGKIEEYEQEVLKRLGFDGQELSILFCNDEFIQELNKNYREIDAPTDILSFENGEEYTDEDGSKWFSAGDIIISLDTLPKNAEYFKVTQNEELKRLLIHGTLHLNGMDHGEEHVGEGLEIKSPMLKKQEEVLKTFSDVELI